jgi:glycosyltransferase involved in cell wall biosynthesis
MGHSAMPFAQCPSTVGSVRDMYENTLVGVVVPAYNEERHIGAVIESVPEFVDRLYVVDDCSTDDTWTEIQAHAASADEQVVTEDGISRALTDGGSGTVDFPQGDPATGPTLMPVRHAKNRGRGGAVKTGYQLAVIEGLDVVAVMDGDGQMDGAILDRMIDPIVNGEADYTKGNRLVDSETWAAMSNWRLFGNAVLTVMTKIASGYYGMRDPQNGYTAVSTETLKDIDVGGLFEGYGFLNDMLVRLSRHDKRVVDVPMEAIYEDEESGIQYRTFVPYLSWLLLKMYVWWLSAWVRTSAGRLSLDPAS